MLRIYVFMNIENSCLYSFQNKEKRVENIKFMFFTTTKFHNFTCNRTWNNYFECFFIFSFFVVVVVKSPEKISNFFCFRVHFYERELRWEMRFNMKTQKTKRCLTFPNLVKLYLSHFWFMIWYQDFREIRRHIWRQQK